MVRRNRPPAQKLRISLLTVLCQERLARIVIRQYAGLCSAGTSADAAPANSDDESSSSSSESSESRRRRRKEKKRKKKEKKREKKERKKKKKRKRSSSSDVERSIISGAVIKRKLDKTDEDKANEARRAQLLDFLNDSRGETG